MTRNILQSWSWLDERRWTLTKPGGENLRAENVHNYLIFFTKRVFLQLISHKNRKPWVMSESSRQKKLLTQQVGLQQNPEMHLFHSYVGIDPCRNLFSSWKKQVSSPKYLKHTGWKDFRKKGGESYLGQVQLPAEWRQSVCACLNACVVWSLTFVTSERCRAAAFLLNTHIYTHTAFLKYDEIWSEWLTFLKTLHA